MTSTFESPALASAYQPATADDCTRLTPARADRRGDGAGQQSRRLVTFMRHCAYAAGTAGPSRTPYFLPFVHRWRFNGDFYPQIAGITSVAHCGAAALWRRGLIIVAIGLAINLVPAFDLATLRWPGVLQRIGVCIIIAAPLVLWSRWRGLVGWTLALMVTYASVLMLWVPVAGPDGAVSRGLARSRARYGGLC